MADENISRRARRSRALKQYQAEVGKTYKVNTFSKASDPINRVQFIPSGSFELDLALGGGWKIGGTHLIWGKEHSGKSVAALMAAGQAQKMCSKCGTHIELRPLEPEPDASPQKMAHWLKARQVCMCCGTAYHTKDAPAPTLGLLDIEPEPGQNASSTYCSKCGSVDKIVSLSKDDDYLEPPRLWSCVCGESDPMVVLLILLESDFDPEWVEALGVNLDGLLIEQPHYGEQGMDVLRSSVRQGLVDVVIVDSVNNLSMSAEIDSSMEDNHMTLTARKVNSLLRQLTGLTRQGSQVKDGVPTTVFLINQIREKIGSGPFGGGHTMFGGLGQLFAAATITKWGRAKQQTNEYVYGNASETFGLGVSVDLSVAVQKNKFAGTTDTTTSFTLIKADDEHGVMRKGMVDDFDRLFKAAKSIGLIRRPEGFNKGWEIDGAPELGSWDVEGELKLSLYQNEQLKRALVRRVIDLTVRNTVAALSGLKQKAKK